MNPKIRRETCINNRIVRADYKYTRLYLGWNKGNSKLQLGTGNIFEDKLQVWAGSDQMVFGLGQVKF
jgi:hypothetical protein